MQYESNLTSPSSKARQEGAMTKVIENQTAKIPSTFFLAMAGAATALSLGLVMTREKKDAANFVGLWVPSLLLLGIYNKIVKTQGSEKEEDTPSLH